MQGLFTGQWATLHSSYLGYLGNNDKRSALHRAVVPMIVTFPVRLSALHSSLLAQLVSARLIQLLLV